MARKPLLYTHIVNVVHFRKGSGERLRSISPTALSLDGKLPSHAPDGCFVPVPNGLLLPRKVRGDRIVVQYEQMFERVF